ncbi:MAG TPA: NAD-dependent succinate-semialdehyde dehydrogenase [Verrucomicrobiae bacterium]|nr:NAD-dependent succinate-semialdehyde dehydrogenase [Verrucomicrobiae bacterium]
MPSEARNRVQSVNPVNGELIQRFETLTPAAVSTILDAAVAAQRDWAKLPLPERAIPMKKVAALLKERAPDYGRIMALEMGKPVKDGIAEANKCASGCEHYADNAAAYLAPREIGTDASKSYVRYDPIGVVLAVMPWNFPFWQVFRFIAPTLMAGNGGVLKHASNVPQCALAIEQVMRDAGFPRDLFRSLLIGSSAVNDLIADPRIAAVTLTGSEAAGRAVGAAAGLALKPVVLELGGSDPFIVLADADLEAAAKTAAYTRCINSGQSCIAAKRFIVVDAVHDAFLAKFTEAMRATKMGDPFDAQSAIGPQARHDLRDELHQQVEQSVKQGARLVLGGTVPPGPGAFYPPTVLADVKPGNLAYRDEIFGPVASVIRARDTEDALRIANDSPFGLGASLWTRDPAVADQLVPRIEAGAVFVNSFVKSDPRLPFGGIKTSGVGRELGAEGIHAFVNAKTVWIK